MRVLFLNDLSDPRIGSSIRQMYQHAARLRELGHETAVVTAVQDPAQEGEREIEGTRVFALRSAYAPRFRGWVGLDNPRVRAGVEGVLAQWRPDVVHAHLIHTHLSYASLGAARRAGAGVVFTAHDVMTFCYQKLTCFHGGREAGGTRRDYRAHWQKCIPCQRLRYNPWRNRAIRRILARDVDRFTAVSEELARAIAANGIRVDRAIHNALQPSASLPRPEDVQAFRAEYGLEGMQVVAMGGRLHEQKGVAEALRMVRLLAGELPRLRLLVLGRREVYEAEFAEVARGLGVAERVVTTGWLDGAELASAYAAADVFLTPSICFDTFGLVNLEAMEHGRPVVATAFGGSPEVVDHGRTGYVENPFDTAACAGRIRELLADPARARALGEEGRRRLLERFTIERLAAEFLEEYRLALGLARARRTARRGAAPRAEERGGADGR